MDIKIFVVLMIHT